MNDIPLPDFGSDFDVRLIPCGYPAYCLATRKSDWYPAGVYSRYRVRKVTDTWHELSISNSKHRTSGLKVQRRVSLNIVAGQSSIWTVAKVALTTFGWAQPRPTWKVLHCDGTPFDGLYNLCWAAPSVHSRLSAYFHASRDMHHPLKWQMLDNVIGPGREKLMQVIAKAT